jgi:hypothetical protein
MLHVGATGIEEEEEEEEEDDDDDEKEEEEGSFPVAFRMNFQPYFTFYQKAFR